MVILTRIDPQDKTPIARWEFPDQPKIRIGRAADNDIVLLDPPVSRYHLEIENMGGPGSQELWRLLSLGTNGTFVNHKLVTQEFLVAGSQIQLATNGPILHFHLRDQPLTAPESPGVPADARSTAPCLHPGNAADNRFCIHCGQPLRIQGTIQGYQILQVLEQGGMGITYLVWSPQVIAGRPRLQVMKEIKADLAMVPKAQELFMREVRILQSLDHPAIPQFFDFFMADEKEYLVMELIHGQSLDQWVERTGPLDPSQAIAWLLEICEILDCLHHQQPPVIHRDIKPSNLLIRNRDGQIVVIDFGVVKEVGSLSETRISVEGYSAPEQGRGHPQPESDLYAVGATALFLLTGKNPNRFYRHTAQGYRLIFQEVPALPAPLRAVLEQATAPKPHDRFASAQELAAALRACRRALD